MPRSFQRDVVDFVSEFSARCRGLCLGLFSTVSWTLSRNFQRGVADFVSDFLASVSRILSWTFQRGFVDIPSDFLAQCRGLCLGLFITCVEDFKFASEFSA